jgi:hypothetical protein
MIWLKTGFLLFQDLLQICADGLGFTTPIPNYKLSWLFLVYNFAMYLDI